MNLFKKVQAFTLAEVLIVLAVLGVVAAMTIPDLIQDYREKATVTAVKRVYSILNQAVDMGVANNGPVETWDWGTNSDGQSAVSVFRENLKPYLRIEKDCGTGTGCWYDGYMKNLGGSNYYNINSFSIYAKALLVDGTSLSLQTWGSCNDARGTSQALQHTCGVFSVDINGAMNPNTLGKDVFFFYITTEGVTPYGTNGDTNATVSNRCRFNGTDFWNGCGCAAWVIKKENMDYLHKTVSW